MRTYNFVEAHKTIHKGILTITANDGILKWEATQENGEYKMRKFVIDGGYWSKTLYGKSRQPEIMHFIECATKFIEGSE